MAMPPTRFVAVGGVWLDEIRTVGKATQKNVLGGSVAFATLGARLFAAAEPTSVRLMFRAGSDFPQEIISILRSWNVALTVHYSETLPSARGVIEYDGLDESRRTYQRLTSSLPTTWEHLTLPDIINATCFHLFESPDGMEAQCNEILRARKGLASRPLLIWEPQGKSCNVKTLDSHIKAARLVDVFSPNNAELQSLFGDDTSLQFDREQVEAQAKYFIDAGVGTDGNGCIIVRCAQNGCLVLSADMEPRWLPSFYSAGSGKVIDATGGGNAFLGGVGIGYQDTGNYVDAAKYGNVAASFVIEQVGVPNVSGEGADELWNGQSVRERFALYEAQLE